MAAKRAQRVMKESWNQRKAPKCQVRSHPSKPVAVSARARRRWAVGSLVTAKQIARDHAECAPGDAASAPKPAIQLLAEEVCKSIEPQDDAARWHLLAAEPTPRQDPCLGAARARTVDWLIFAHDLAGLPPPALFLAVRLLDLAGPLPPSRPPLFAAAALAVAAKFEERAPQGLEAMVAGCFTAAEVRAAELALLRRLGWRVHVPTAAHHLASIQTFCGTGEEGSLQQLLSQFLCELGLACPEAPSWPPLLHAAAAALLAAALLRREPPRPLLRAGRGVALRAAVGALRRALEDCSPHDAVYCKYAKDTRQCVALKAGTLLCGLPASPKLMHGVGEGR